MLNIYTYWSLHYNEVIIIVAETSEQASARLKEIYMPGCDVDDWIIGGSIPVRLGSSTSVHIVRH